MEILNKFIASFDLNTKIGEIFVVDIEFNAYNDPRKEMYNEVYPCIFQPKSKVPADRRSVYQLLSTMRIGKNGNILKFSTTKKTHATLDPKKRSPMFIDHIHFLSKRAKWIVTMVYNYYTFEQEPLKRNYILGNQKSRQEAVALGDDVQGNFYRLLNNVNFGFDCRNNSQKKSLHLVYDEDTEIELINKYEGYKSKNCFLSLEAKIKNIQEKYDDVENLPVDKQPFAETLKKAEIKRLSEKFNKKSKSKRSKVLNYEERLNEAYSDKSYTFVQDLEADGVNSVKTVACTKQTVVKVSTRYLSSKLLINFKISLGSFIYDCIDTFCFPEEKTLLVYGNKVLPYLLMIDTDSASLEFIVIAKDSCDCGEREMRDVLLRIFLENDIQRRLDLSGEFFEQFSMRNVAARKQVDFYEFKNIEHGIICAICVNPKEYFELYGILYETNKKQKGVRKGTKGMDFDKYASRILTIEDAREGTNRFANKQKQARFQNNKGNMIMVTIEKREFGQLNDKRYALCDGISCLPYRHKDLIPIENFKKEIKVTPQTPIKSCGNNLLRFEQGIIQGNERVRVINSVLLQRPIFYKKCTLKRSQFQIQFRGSWRKI